MPTTWQRLRQSSFFLNLASLSGATVLNRLIGLATLGYSARVLGPDRYGMLGFGASITAYAGILLSPGLTTWGLRAIAREPASAGRTMVLVNATQFVLAFVGFAGLAAFSFFGVHDPLERSILLLCGLLLFQNALNADWVLSGLELPRIPAMIGVLGTAASTVALLTLVRHPADVRIAATLPVLTGLATTVAGYVVLLRLLRVRPQWPTPSQFRVALLASLPLGATLALVVVLHYANNVIVRAYLGAAELGVFLAAFRLFELASTIPSVLSNAFFPRLARTVANAPDRAAREARLFARVHMVPAFLGAAFMLAESPTIIRLIYGPRYAAAAQLLQVMSVAIVFNYAICGYTNCLISYGRDRVMLAVVAASTVVSVAGGLLAVPRFGGLGAAGVVAAIDLVGWLVSLRTYRRVIGSLQFAAWVWPAIGAGCVVLASLLLQSWHVPWWWRGPLLLGVYLPVVVVEFRSATRAG